MRLTNPRAKTSTPMRLILLGVAVLAGLGTTKLAFAVTFTPAATSFSATAGYCGSNDVIPNCNLITSCGSFFSSPASLTTSATDSSGYCGYGKLRVETTDGSTGRRALVCLDVSDCTGSAVCKYNKGSTGAYAIGYKCLQKSF